MGSVFRLARRARGGREGGPRLCALVELRVETPEAWPRRERGAENPCGAWEPREDAVWVVRPAARCCRSEASRRRRPSVRLQWLEKRLPQSVPRTEQGSWASADREGAGLSL